MSDVAASLVLLVAAAYVGLGMMVGAAFVTIGLGRIDPSAIRAPFGFRLIVLPASTALWPWVLLVWWRRSSKQADAPAVDPAKSHRSTRAAEK